MEIIRNQKPHKVPWQLFGLKGLGAFATSLGLSQLSISSLEVLRFEPVLLIPCNLSEFYLLHNQVVLWIRLLLIWCRLGSGIASFVRVVIVSNYFHHRLPTLDAINGFLSFHLWLQLVCNFLYSGHNVPVTRVYRLDVNF